jgi:hypothetical protein
MIYTAMKPDIIKPIIIACAGRSGSTLYYRMIARHRDVAWLSTWNQKLPSHTWVSGFSNLYRMQACNRVRHAYWFPKPFSPYRFWARYLPDIARHDRPPTAADVSDEAIEPVRRAVAKVLRFQRRKRFLAKVTGWARMAYFNRIFPDARFIYLKRDPIAIMSSWVKAGWLNVTADIDSNDWEWGDVPAEYRRIWKDLGGGPLLSAAVKTQLDIDDLRRNAAQFADRCFELDYEELVRDPVRSMRETLDFCELVWDDSFERVVTSTVVHNYTGRWKHHLTLSEGERVRAFFARAQQVAATV